MDETYIKVKGQWKYFYRAVDKAGKTKAVSKVKRNSGLMNGS
jgi:transposase-like protein